MEDRLATSRSTAKATNRLLMRSLYSFQEGNVIGKGMFYKKGHLMTSWKNRAWVINDFSTNKEEISERDGQFRYYEPQKAQNYDRDTSREHAAHLLGLNAEQKTIKLDTVYFSPGKKQNIKDCETINQRTAFALNIKLVTHDEGIVNLNVQKEDVYEYELVFDYQLGAEDFIRALYQASKRCPNLDEFIKNNQLNRKNVLRSPRLTFEPSYQTSLGCVKIAPYCTTPDCFGWGSYCACMCCEMYSQGGLLFDMQTPISQLGHMAAPVYAQCCVLEAPICECRMIKEVMCKLESEVCCIDLRCALPTDEGVPFEIALLGCRCFGNQPDLYTLEELKPLKGGVKEPVQTGLDKFKAMVGGNI